MKRNVILIGAPGSGKGTQCDLLKTSLNMLKVAPGDILREYRKDSSKPFYVEINTFLDSGRLLPDDIINNITEDFIKKSFANFHGLLIDGYPRSVAQASHLEKILLELNTELNHIILLEIKLEDLIERLQNRYMCAKCGAIYNHHTKKTKVDGECDECGSVDFITRSDDGEEAVIRTRFAEFMSKTAPVIEHYQSQGRLKIVNAKADISIVHKDVLQILKNESC